MAGVVTATRPITRNKLAQWLPNHEAVKALENLTADVPALGAASNDLQGQLDLATARISVLEGEIAGLEVQISTLNAEVVTLQLQIASLQNLTSDTDALTAQVANLRGQLTFLSRSVNSILNSPSKP